MSPPLLVLAGVSKRYPGVQAVRDAHFECRPHEIHALVGENGAGKSTLLGIAAGTVDADAGRVEIVDRQLTVASPRAALERGVGMVYQDDSLIPDLSVAENLLLAAPRPERPSRAHLSAWTEQELGRFEVRIDPRATVRDLSVAARQIVEIVKAFVSNPRVLLLDEPTAALGPSEVGRLHALLRELIQRGTAVVYVTHRLREVLDVASRISVMRDGQIVEAGLSPDSVDEDALVRLMVGRTLQTTFPPKPPEHLEGAALLSARRLSSSDFSAVNFDAHAGEILGFAGIEGNGQREVLRALVGLTRRRGEIRVDGRTVPGNDISAARKSGIAYLSADRRREGLFMGLSVRENITASVLAQLASAGIVPRSRQREFAQREARAVSLQTWGMEQPVSTLSGGNQQKVALARAFLTAPKVYVIDEPTLGVDAGTRLEMYRVLRSVAREGAVVIVLSSDAVELAGLCDRVLVFSRGRVIRELAGDDVTEDNMVGAAVRTDVHRERDDSPFSRARFLRWAGGSDFAPVTLVLISLLALGTAASIARPQFLSTLNIGDLLFLAVPLAFAALAQCAVMLIGGIDLSVGPVMALTTVALSQVMKPEGGAGNDAVAIAVALAIGMGIGLLNAILINRFRIVPLIATLATFILVQGLALLWLPVVGGFIAADVMQAASARVGFLPLSFLGLLVIAPVAELVYRRTSGGLWYRAVGSRRVAADRLGARVSLIDYGAYVAAGFLAAVAGVFFAATIGIGHPTLGVGFTLASIAAVALGGLSTWGGRGSIVGPLLGATLLAVIANASAFFNLLPYVQLFVQGGLMLGAIAIYSKLRAVGSAVDEPTAR